MVEKYRHGNSHTLVESYTTQLYRVVVYYGRKVPPQKTMVLFTMVIPW